MKKWIPYIIIAVLLIYILCIGRNGRNSPRTYTDTIIYVDTICYFKPIPKDSLVVRYISVTVPKIAENDTILTDSVPKIAENVTKDSVSVQIPITQKVYEDSTYKAYVSGFHANLDSIFVYQKRSEVFIRQKPHRWHLGPSAGLGVTPKGRVEPFIGLTLTYSLFGW